MTFSEHLSTLREQNGLTQKEIAKELGISTLTYQRYEYGEREPKLSALIALADYYKLSLDELVCRERNP
ncbi:MAG: helix-turn-helix transcriptional regulator [Oscillospiraceae bacterium]|jgi:transcriptional regulator with XRE-family HTH domain|nr:helix-turn-helix transcriptional regulator [Oscillospiraceae bacterium]MDE6997281.1 helix-turn-helix transcriptional regulator [Oscillospiraceae bacterium]